MDTIILLKRILLKRVRYILIHSLVFFCIIQNIYGVNDESSKMISRLESIIIPHAQLENITPNHAVRYLKEISEKHDPERVGINFTLLPGENNKTIHF